MLSTLPSSELEKSIQAALESSAYFPLRRLTFTEVNGVVTLRGCVPSFYLKQVAQSLLRSFPEIRKIKDEVIVVSPDRRFSVCGAGFGLDVFRNGEFCS